jgi:hypothetical protein
MFLQVFLGGVVTGVLLLISIFLFKMIINYILVNREESWIGIGILISMLFLFASCSKEEFYEDVCGDCLVKFEVPFDIDSNGYYHAKLKYNGSGAARFNIDTYATISEDAYTYSIFKGDIVVNESMMVDMVQESRLNHDNKGYTKRIVGPVLTKFIGDTLTVNVETYWEGNASWEVSKNTLKFIIE